MSWWRRRRSVFDEIFEEIKRIEESILSLMDEELEKALRMAEKEGVRSPLIYGVRVTIGPDGVPKIEEFGNVKMTRMGKPIVREEIEPLVDVIEDDDEIWVIAELPGADKDKIKVRATPRKIVIRAEGEKKYYKEIELPAEIDPDTAKASYRNGVLEIRVKKKKAEAEGKEIKVE